MISFFAGIIFIGGAYFLIGYFRAAPGGILVNSSPVSNVFVNGELVGKTPYEGTFEAGEIVLKLVPESTDKNYIPHESKVTLVSGVKTIVRREFSENEETASGDTISFEQEGGKEASIVVVTSPDNAQVSIDGTVRGFTPFKSSNLLAGEPLVAIKLPGYIDRTLTIKTILGYKLTIIAKLAKIPEEVKVKAVTTEVKVWVEILDTPTGFLRVRSEPGSAGREIHQVMPGNKFLFLEEDGQTGWYKIQLEDPTAGLPDGRIGWVSNEYSKKIEESFDSDIGD